MGTFKPENVRWIYIAGRGHSGSTVLDAMLGNASGIESVGELVSGMGRYDAACSCGQSFRECHKWKEVRDKFEVIDEASWDHAVKLSVRQAHVTRFLSTLLTNRDREWVRQLARTTRNIGAAIAGSSSVVVDSSKEISRALFLAKFVPETKVIHLVRHPDGILASDLFRIRSGVGFKILRRHFPARRFPGAFLLLSCLGWVMGNILALLVSAAAPRTVVRLKYEDLVENPLGEIDRLQGFLNVSLNEVRARIEDTSPFMVGHNIGGNNMRMARSFLFDPAKSTERKLPLRYRIMSRIVCWPVMLIYGYR